MTALEAHLFSPTEYSLQEISEADLPRIVEAYGLLQEAMGTDAVENLNAFRQMTSASTDAFVVPRVVCALHQDKMIGVIVGAYLKRLNLGFIAYSAVSEPWRRHGVYSAMRESFLSRLSVNARISGVVSELEGDEWLYHKYLTKWKAIALPCDYEQPGVQGLQVKALKLMVQPLADGISLDEDDVVAIVSELYRGIYRIADVAENASFQRVVASVGTGLVTAKAD